MENQLLYTGKNTYNKTFIIISYDEQNKWLVTNWEGRQTETTIKQGVELILKYLKETKSTKVLNNNEKVEGPWGYAADWSRDVWFPLMISAGLKHFAWVQSEDVFSRFATKKVIVQSEKKLDIKDDKSMVRISLSIKESIEWLKCVD